MLIADETREQPIRLLVIGPLPPPVGGATVLFRQLVQELSDDTRVALQVINTARRRGLLSNLARAIAVVCCAAAKMSSVDVVSVHCSVGGGYGLGSLLCAVCRIFGKPVIVRGFGGRIWQEKFLAFSSVRRWIFAKTFLAADKVFFEAKSTVGFFSQRFASSVVEWYPNSRPHVDVESKAKAQTGGGGSLRLVYVGHVRPEKGIDILIEALSGINIPCSVDLYGSLMVGLDTSAFAPGQINYRGELEPERVITTMSGYDALVFPSRWVGEGYPGVIIEAYIAGIPVITSDIGGIPEIVNESTGILVRVNDPEALRSAIERFALDSELSERLKKGAQKAADQFESRKWTDYFVVAVNSVFERYKG